LRTSLIYHPDCLAHDTGEHPERAERLRAILRAVAARWGDVALEIPDPAPVETLALCHDPAYIAEVEQFAAAGGGLWEIDTVVSGATYEAARLAAGAALRAVDHAVAGRPAFALARPPGHHALPDQAMGFCFFNNAAVAARYALRVHGVRHVLIVDWDVHHGNGTQAIFYLDPSVAYFSTHQYPFYPMTGVITEIGAGDGYATTCNVPLPGGCRDAEYRAVFRDVLEPFAQHIRPDLIIISAGYDAHRLDPLGGMLVTAAGFAALMAEVTELAAALCGGRVALVLEGGYSLEGLAESVVATLDVLEGAAPPPPSAGRPHPAITQLIDQVRALHRLW
jgi:acetoin utilization deacetylase AcuC-like enzyme